MCIINSTSNTGLDMKTLSLSHLSKLASTAEQVRQSITLGNIAVSQTAQNHPIRDEFKAFEVEAKSLLETFTAEVSDELISKIEKLQITAENINSRLSY